VIRMETITQWQRDLFHTNVHLTLSQRDSILENTVRREVQHGRVGYYDILDPTQIMELTVRHANTPRIDMNHRRRSMTLRNFIHATSTADEDKVKLSIQDPTSTYHEAVKRQFNVQKDLLISDALFGDATEEVDFHTGVTAQVPLPASQIIPVNYVKSGPPVNSGLTLDKLRQAKYLLRKGQQNPGAKLYLAMTNDQLDDLLGLIEVTSGDFNAIKPLVSGDVGHYMGFEIKVFDGLPFDSSSGIGKIAAYANDSVIFGVGRDFEAKVDPLPERNYETQLYTRATYGALRLEDKGVVAIDCEV